MNRKSVDIEGYKHGANPIPAASRIGYFVATGGVHGLDRATGHLPAEPAAQMHHLFANMGDILTAAGVSWGEVLKLNFVIADGVMRDYLNAEWLAVFPDADRRPARYTSINPHLPKGILVQCEALAIAAD